MQRHDFERLTQEFSTTDGDEITCDLAAWSNVDARGPFLTVQISPRYVAKPKQAVAQPDVDYFLDGWGDV
jgi:hypothetical protein